MYRGPHARADISRAWRQVTKWFIVSECDNLLDFLGSASQSSEDAYEVAPVLHWDDAELVFFVDPDQEGLVVIVEDATTFRPFTVKPCGLKESITFFEQEVVLDELGTLIVVHGC